MEEMTQQKDYGQFKTELDNEFKRSAEGFVKIGYLLRIAQDTEILHESGYKNVAEFAKAEYGLNKDAVSRYMAINQKYSVDGYSDKLTDHYSKFGYAKLTEILTLPDAIAEEISPAMPRSEIQEIKHGVREEEKVSDIERMLEDPGRENQTKDIRSQVVFAYYREHKEEYVDLFMAAVPIQSDSRQQTNRIMDVIAGPGYKAEQVRIDGMGRILFSVKGPEVDITYANIRTEEKVYQTWPEFIGMINTEMNASPDPKTSWELLYNMPFEEPKIIENTKADVDLKQKEQKIVDMVKKEEPKKQQIVENTKTDETFEKDNAEAEKSESCTGATDLEENSTQTDEAQIPGQSNITDFPEYMPKGTLSQPEVAEKPESPYEQLKSNILLTLQTIKQDISEDKINTAWKKCGALIGDITTLKELKEMEEDI